MHAASGPWDLVLISGNLTLAGSSLEFELLNSTLDSLWKYLNSLGSSPSLLVVPGPSDFRLVHRVSVAGKKSTVQHRAAAVRKAFQGKGSKTLKQDVVDALEPFSAWFHAWEGAHPRA